MGRNISRMGTGGALAALLLILTACDGSAPQQPPPPPMASADASSQSPALLGGPPAPADSGSSSAFPMGSALDNMEPIPNPEDMSPAERARVYGHRYHYADSERPHATFAAGTMEPISGPLASRKAPQPAAPEASPPAKAAPTATVAAAPSAPAIASAATAKPQTVASAKPFSFPLLDLEKQFKALMKSWAPVAGPRSMFDVLSIPGLPDVDVPGLGKVPSKSVVVSALLVLAMILLAVAARIVNERREAAERRRKFRTMAGQAEPAPETARASPAGSPAPAFKARADVSKDAAETQAAPTFEDA